MSTLEVRFHLAVLGAGLFEVGEPNPPQKVSFQVYSSQPLKPRGKWEKAKGVQSLCLWVGVSSRIRSSPGFSNAGSIQATLDIHQPKDLIFYGC